MTKILAILVTVLLASAAQAQSTRPPARQSNVGTWAELEERSWIEDVRAAIQGTSGKSVSAQRTIGQRLGRCMADRAPGDARTVVLEMMSQAAVKRRFPRLFHCWDDKSKNVAMASLEIPSPTLQLWLADALVRRDYSAPGASDFSGVAIAAPKSSLAASGSSDASWNVVRKLGECIARRTPEPVRQLAQTDVATPAESAAMTALAPTMGMCLPPGSTVRLRTSDVRGSALLSYYQLSHAANSARGGLR